MERFFADLTEKQIKRGVHRLPYLQLGPILDVAEASSRLSFPARKQLSHTPRFGLIRLKTLAAACELQRHNLWRYNPDE